MARQKKIVKTPVKVMEEKLDGVFRIFQITNSLKGKTVVRIELPNNEVHEREFGNLPRFEVVVPYVGEKFELYLDDKFIGIHSILEADKSTIAYEMVSV